MLAMKKRNFLFVFIILTLLFSCFAVVEAQNFDFQTNYVFDIKKDGSTDFIIQNKVSLDTKEEENSFESFIINFTENKEDELSIFINDTKPIVEQATKETGREMYSLNYSINVEKVETITGTYGLVEYKFLWTNFTQKTSSSLILGDVFVGGLNIESNDSLTVKSPEKTNITLVEPVPDKKNSEVKWNGPINFEEGEPEVKFNFINDSKNGTDPRPEEKNNLMLFLSLGGISLIIIIVSVMIYLRNKSDSDEVYDLKNDQKIILDLIQKNEGQMFQNQIVKETDFSKAKVSNILNELKEKGKIKKIKKGRKNLIRIN